jgi:hypothetical protein
MMNILKKTFITMKKFVSESLNEYMDNFERGEDPRKVIGLGDARFADLHIDGQEWLQDEEEFGEIDVIGEIKNSFPDNNIYFVGYGDSGDEEEEERVEKIQDVIGNVSGSNPKPLSSATYDAGDLTVYKLENGIIVVELGDHDSNWFTNAAGMRAIQ